MRLLRLLFIIGILAAIIAAVAATVYGWLLGQTIFLHTYNTKAGVNYWATWTLKNNIFTASLLLAMLSSLITIWSRSSFLSFLSALSQPGPAVRTKLDTRTAIIWRVLEFGAFFLYYVSIGGYAITGQNVAFLLMLAGDGSISISPTELTTLFSLPFAPGTSAQSIQDLIPAMEAYQLYLGLVATLIFVTAARVSISIVTDLMMQRRDIYIVISKGLIVASLIILLEILRVPMWTVNAGTWMSYLALIIALFACLFGSFAFMVVRVRSGDVQQRLKSKIAALEGDLARLQGELLSLRQEYESAALSAEDYRKRVGLLMEDRAHIANELRRLKLERLLPIGNNPRAFGLLTIFLIAIIVMLPITQGLYYGIQMNGDKYVDWKFNLETQKEIEITNWATGLTNLEILSLDALTSNATPASEIESLTTVRQWDQTASYLRMRNQIGANWMQLADSDIIYFKNHEYWVAPLTFELSTTWTNFINQYIIYTHTEGMLVLDAFSGELVEKNDLVALINRTEGISFYYGEGLGFSESVFVNVANFEEVGNATFKGTPDYTLRGFESFYYLLTLGPSAWSYLGQEMDMLVQRDINARVNSILLQGLTADKDPYIVISPNGEIFYAVSVFIDYHLSTGYAHENYLRFLGVVLVDIGTGEMAFYESPTMDDDFFLDNTYKSYYDWKETPSWLQSQMKWPEDLYERQLRIAYIFHVDDPNIWLGGVDFHQAPKDSDTRYVIMNIGGEERFIAYHNAEFRISASAVSAYNLAGIYVMGCGDKNFGQMVFYRAGESGSSNWLGPTAVVQAFETKDDVRTQLQFWGKHRYGNRLIYHLGGDLFFIVPVFLEVETSTNTVIQKLGGVGLVDARTGERVELGDNVIEAYYKMFGLLNRTVIEQGEVGFESVVFDPITIDSGALTSLIALMRNNDNASHHLYLDIVTPPTNLQYTANFSIQWHGSQVIPVLSGTNATFTLDIGNIGAGDLYGTAPSVTVHLAQGTVFQQFLIQIILRTEDGIVDQINLFLTVT
ncbi:hypothetical protein EU527_11390 [Candidatus Thorarchaeota archaeon]|nr:MAG: hypothetical protein EU527_11390 [Candidatus Thorarchaeota archaeon]